MQENKYEGGKRKKDQRMKWKIDQRDKPHIIGVYEDNKNNVTELILKP